MTAFTRRRWSRATIGRAIGYVTSKPPVRPLMVKGAAELRRVLQPRLPGRVKLGKRFGGTVIPPPTGPAFIVVPNILRPVSTMFTRRRIESTHLTRPRIIPAQSTGGHVRALQVIGQAFRRRQMQPRFATHAEFQHAHGGIITPPSVPTAIFHSWHVKSIGIKTKGAVHSQVDSETGDTP